MKFKYQAELIKRIRSEKGLSQEELSRVCNYASKQLVSNIERGLCGIPIHMANALLRAYPDLYKWDFVDAFARDNRERYEWQIAGRETKNE